MHRKYPILFQLNDFEANIVNKIQISAYQATLMASWDDSGRYDSFSLFENGSDFAGLFGIDCYWSMWKHDDRVLGEEL